MSELNDLLIPCWENIFIIPDEAPTILGIGLGGGTIVAPDAYAEKVNVGHNRTGVVEFAGWEALRQWPTLIGKRVAWSRAYGTSLGPKGAGRRIQLNSISEITCWFSQGTPDTFLSDAWTDFARARPGTILVERVDPPQYRGAIEIPAGFRVAYRQSEAIIIDAGDGVDKATFFPGRRVFLPGQSNVRLEFGGRTFYQIFPRYIVAIFRDDARDLKVEKELPSPSEMMSGIEPPETRFDEGDSRGPQ